MSERRAAPSSKRRRADAESRSDAEALATTSKAHRPKVDKPSKRSRFDIPSDTLKWKPVKTAPVAGFDEGGGMMMLEELEGVDVQWEEGINGQKVAHFKVGHAGYCRERLGWS
jgi:hypothetical protein